MSTESSSSGLTHTDKQKTRRTAEGGRREEREKGEKRKKKKKRGSLKVDGEGSGLLKEKESSGVKCAQ